MSDTSSSTSNLDGFVAETTKLTGSRTTRIGGGLIYKGKGAGSGEGGGVSVLGLDKLAAAKKAEREDISASSASSSSRRYSDNDTDEKLKKRPKFEHSNYRNSASISRMETPSTGVREGGGLSFIKKTSSSRTEAGGSGVNVSSRNNDNQRQQRQYGDLSRLSNGDSKDFKRPMPITAGRRNGSSSSSSNTPALSSSSASSFSDSRSEWDSTPRLATDRRAHAASSSRSRYSSTSASRGGGGDATPFRRVESEYRDEYKNDDDGGGGPSSLQGIEEWEQEQLSVDREWYGMEESSGANDETHNQYSDYESYWKEKEEEYNRQQVKRISGRQQMFNRDNDLWEANRMLTSGVAQRSEGVRAYNEEEDMEERRTAVLVRDLKPVKDGQEG